jgi:hypothetical protein
MIRCLTLLFATVLLGGCGPDSEDGGPEPRGTPACHKWQGAVCNWMSRCGASTEQVSTCREQAAGITCTSDEAANACVTQLSGSSCAEPPVGCDIRDLADPTPALAACDQFVDALCSAAERCGQGKAECLADPTLQTVCVGVIGHKPTFEQCISELGTISCSASDGPAVCDGVILK